MSHLSFAPIESGRKGTSTRSNQPLRKHISHLLLNFLILKIWVVIRLDINKGSYWVKMDIMVSGSLGRKL